jgi:pimeloyl-ACP methyl ester carboxylesterase
MKKHPLSLFQLFFARSLGAEFFVNDTRFQAAPALPAALRAERFEIDGVSCYVAGSGPALLLVHSVNAAASAAEMRPIFEYYRATRTVFAIDLPGYGFSDRSDRAYTPRLMTDALHGVAKEIRLRCGHAPIDAVALSLGCEFLARAAQENPAEWGRLALVSPTGLNARAARQAPREGTRFNAKMHAVLSVPLWANSLFRALTRPGVIRYFLERTWGSKAIDETAWAYAVKTAREPGARFAPFHFISGGLFSTDIQRIYGRLGQPVWLSHGTRGDFTDYQGKATVQGLSDWKATVFNTGAMPYFERPDDFFAEFNSFLRAPLSSGTCDVPGSSVS